MPPQVSPLLGALRLRVHRPVGFDDGICLHSLPPQIPAIRGSTRCRCRRWRRAAAAAAAAGQQRPAAWLCYPQLRLLRCQAFGLCSSTPKSMA